jgi:signal transduction histidine kinase
MNSKIVSSHRLFAAFSVFFLISGVFCYSQLRSLYLKDLSILQQSLRQRSDRLDERVRRGVVIVDSLQSTMATQLKQNLTQSPETLEHQENLLENSLKAFPDAMRIYSVGSTKSSFLPKSFPEVHDSSLLLEPFFKLGRPDINPIRSPYWTKSSASQFGNGMIISRAAPVYLGDQFAGVVGVDILINNLMDTVRDETYRGANIFVVGHDRNLLLHPSFNKAPNQNPIAATTALPPELQPHLERILQGESGQMQSMAGYQVMYYNLQNLPWHSVMWIPERKLWLETVKSSFWSSVVPWLALMTMLGVIVGEVRRRNIIQSNLQLKTIDDLQLKTSELSDTLAQLKQTQAGLIQNEKMSSLGHLVGGIAHEINNPVNFIHGNLKPAQEYIQSLLTLIGLYEKNSPQIIPKIQDYSEDVDLDFIKIDLPMIMKSMGNGTARIREIVLLLRNFARMDESELKIVDLHEGIESTVAILRHRLVGNHRRPEITLKKLFGTIPNVECYAGLINQVFMALLSNAVDAINACSAEQLRENPPTLEIITAMAEDDRIHISIRDNGTGIPDTVIAQIFDPFFTTKVVGQGTGLGLAIAHQIITERHGGKLTCTTQTQMPNCGSTFTIELPVNQLAQVKSTQAILSPQSSRQSSKPTTLR